MKPFLVLGLAACGLWGCAGGPVGMTGGAAGSGAAGAPTGAAGTGVAGTGAAGAGLTTGAAGATQPPDAAPEAPVASSPDAAAQDVGRETVAPEDAVREAGSTDISDAVLSDAAHGAGCASSTLALCEDFESGALDTKTWKASARNGTATLDTSRAARGSKASVHIHVDPGSDTMVGLVETKTFPALKSKLFARAYVYIPGAMSTSLFTGDRHSRLIYAQGANPYGEYALGIWNGGLIQNHYSKTDDSVDTKMLPPFDRWFCLEYELDAAAGNVRAYLDDVEITALRHDGWPATAVASLMFGVDRFGNFPVAEDLWFDDLAVDGARIGCAR